MYPKVLYTSDCLVLTVQVRFARSVEYIRYEQRVVARRVVERYVVEEPIRVEFENNFTVARLDVHGVQFCLRRHRCTHVESVREVDGIVDDVTRRAVPPPDRRR